MNLLLTALLLALSAVGGEADSLKVARHNKGSERNVMLNAESASVPRELNIGLPEGGTGAVVFIDGVRSTHGFCRSFFHWAGGNAYEPMGSISLMESVITTGEIGIPVDSHTKMGGDTFGGKVSATTSTNGLLKLDAALSGPFRNSKGWYYGMGAYVNLDPGAVKAPLRSFIDNKQIFQFSLSRRWKDADLNFIYRFSLCGDRVDNCYSMAPFIYNGDGTISTYNNFRIGKDCYFPSEGRFEYMDIATGKMHSGDLSGMDYISAHDVSVVSHQSLPGGWKLKEVLHLLFLPKSEFLKITLTGIDKASSGSGITRTDGTFFDGYVQNRQVYVNNQATNDVNLMLTAENCFGNHKIKADLELFYVKASESQSGFTFAHTVEANPQRLLRKGKWSWAFNKSGTYVDAHKVVAALDIIDKWALVPGRLDLKLGARFMPFDLHADTAAKLQGDTKNTRVDGFNIADPKLCDLHHLRKVAADYAFSANLSCRITGRLFAITEGFYSMTNKSASFYKNATIPSLKPIGNALGRGGFTWDCDKADLTAMFSYITCWNSAAIITVTKQIKGVSETIPWTAEYGIGTMGVTLDGNLRHEGFRLHTLFTWQDPRYKNYDNDFVFSDGSHQKVSYTGKFVTGISQVLVELDPSYSWDTWRVWLSGRYYSRQYVCRTNNAYFNGRFETFGGVDKRFSDNVKLSLNFVNLLFQNGAKGKIDVADTITDPAELQGIIMSGTYIRPFMVELGITCNI